MQITMERLREALACKFGSVLTPELAVEVLCAAVDRDNHALDPQAFAPRAYGKLTFQAESFRDILPELEPLHAAHYAETEQHLAGIALAPDYAYMAERERMGSLLQFTARDAARRLVGNLRVYLGRSLHTGRRFAEEDTIYLLPVARRGGAADAFMDYAEAALARLGIDEARADTKLVNHAGRWLNRRGYVPVATKHIKQLRKDDHVL
jgi:GNAT superfamily N-acetyltransferase